MGIRWCAAASSLPGTHSLAAGEPQRPSLAWGALSPPSFPTAGRQPRNNNPVSPLNPPASHTLSSTSMTLSSPSSTGSIRGTASSSTRSVLSSGPFEPSGSSSSKVSSDSSARSLSSSTRSLPVTILSSSRTRSLLQSSDPQRRQSWLRRRTVSPSAPHQFAGHVVVSQRDMWMSGAGGYDTFRIPALLYVGGGVVLAFCEGRRASSADSGDIDVLLRRSTDGGVTWDSAPDDDDNAAGGGGDEDGADADAADADGDGVNGRGDDWAGRIICSNGHDTCDNPTPIFDAQKDRVLLLVNAQLATEPEHLLINAGSPSGHGRKTFLYTSDDRGASWQGPRDITGDIARPQWNWNVVGPGGGIQLRGGAGGVGGGGGRGVGAGRGPAGRLIAPSNFVDSSNKSYGSYIIFSDDHGATWTRGGTIADPKIPSNEAAIAELANGTLVMNMRVMHTQPHVARSRAVASSTDGGISWVNAHYHAGLPDPSCQGSLHFVPSHGVLLFSNAASPVVRERMMVRASLDGGATWPHALILHFRNAAYSSVTTLRGADGVVHVLCLYEAGMEDDGPLVPQGGAHYKRVRLARFPLDDLLALNGIGMAEKASTS
eukprot:jgi/Mesvir1/18731/Mv01243-RA.1